MTDSQYLASIEVSEDQNTIKRDGVTFVAAGHGDDSSCKGCIFSKSKEGCKPIPCTQGERFDGNFVIFTAKEECAK